MPQNELSAKAVTALVESIRPLLAGQPPAVQGAALTDLVAIHLAGHFVRDDPEETSRLREHLLSLHVETVRALIPVNEGIILADGGNHV